MKYKHVVFDLDGTLIDTEYMILHYFHDLTLAIKKIDYPLDHFRFALGIPYEYIISRLELSPEEIAKVDNQEIQTRYLDTDKIYEGIEDVLKYLKNNGHSIGLVTSKVKDNYYADLTKHHIYDYFDIYVGAEQTSEHKPLPAPLYKYMELSGCKKEEMIYVGDSEYDMACAKNAGVDSILATWGAYQDLEATYKPQKPIEIIDIVK